MHNTEKSKSNNKFLRTKVSRCLLFVFIGGIVFRTTWLEGYSTRPRWLPSAVPNKSVGEMKRDLRIWGSVLVAIGVFGILLSGFLDPVWGIVLVIFGATALGIQERSMFIPLGMALLFAGLINLSAGGFGVESIFGLLMVVLGAQEIRTIRIYAPTSA
ncbi:MAG: hypothetical protein PHN90_00520 [Methanothrix sp.]|nr:hypothetical protein [Methanothrix sp.]OPX81267.1 MAG: hypothetical protein A4E50_01103 [Methanosaeta sp. PtaB.Bin087]OPY57580.1 MAG: hypothetical protein A4E51_00031 [Methanosaeta sp. PtaU1.Bin055]NLX39393.1 hypothetical protein [Methanothrix sp.]HNR56843.1 hypothetical protein [Methanothrix sp.]